MYRINTIGFKNNYKRTGNGRLQTTPVCFWKIKFKFISKYPRLFLLVLLFLGCLNNILAQGIPKRLANYSSWIVGIFFIWALFKIVRLKTPTEEEKDLLSYEEDDGPLDQMK